MKMLKKILSYILSLVVAVAMMNLTSVQAAEPSFDSFDPSPEISYAMDGDVVIEKTDFIDSDGTLVNMERMVYPDGTAKASITKNNESKKYFFTGYDYKTFYIMAKGRYPKDIHEPMTRGSDLTGSQYKHVYITSNSGTLYRSDFNTLNNIISTLLLFCSGPSGKIVGLAQIIYSQSSDNTIWKYVVSESIYEVWFAIDNSYYIHCYHDYVKAYDSAGHLVNSFWDYRQAIGG